MHNRRRFLKSIAGALVASAIPKPLNNLGNITDKTEVKVTFYEYAMQKQARRLADQLEKSMWAGNLTKKQII